MFKFKKVASLLASTLMVGSTFALAATAANYPAPFVEGGNAEVAIIYGSNAASTDLVAAIDVSTNLHEALIAQGGGDEDDDQGDATGGDSVLMSKSSDNINILDDLATVFGSTVDDEDLDDLLADGIYTNDENTEFEFEQRITLGAALEQTFFSTSDYKAEEPTIGINLSSSHFVLNYTVNFIDRIESDVSSGEFIDFETTSLHLLGKDYFILDADNATNIKFTLLDSANGATLSEGESTSVVVGDNTYEVTIAYISSSEVKLTINGEETNSLAEGATYKLSDGSYLGVKDILYNEKENGISSVEFSIGKGKLELTSGSDIKLNDDTIDGVKAFITKGAENGAKHTISKIVMEWITDDEEFITTESSLTMPGFEAIKFTMDKFVKPTEEKLILKNSGSGKMQLTLTLEDGEVTIPMLYASSQNLVGIGESATKQVLSLETNVSAGFIYNDSLHDWMVASWNSSKDHESYVLRFTSFSKTDGVNKTTVQKLTPDGWETVCADRTDSSSAPTCDIGSLTLTLNSIRATSADTDYVNLTGNAGSNFQKLYTKEGLEVNFPWEGGPNSTRLGAINFSLGGNATINNNASRFNLQVIGEDKDGTLGIGALVRSNVTVQTDNDVEVSSVLSLAASQTFSDPDNDDNLVGIAVGATSGFVPIEFWRIGSSSAQRNAEIIYYGDESYGTFYLSSPETTFGNGTDGGSDGGGSTNIVSIADTQAASVSSKHWIVVGGSCVNTVAADLLGSATPLCGADFTASTDVGAGQFLIETFSRSGGKIATLVAGYNAGDTTNAAQYLTTQEVMTDPGKKYIGTSATSATLVTDDGSTDA